MRCVRDPDFDCPALRCGGRGDPERCDYLKQSMWRRAHAAAMLASLRPAIDPDVRDRVLRCQRRGPEGGLPLLEDECRGCGGGAERTACSAGKGEKPGRVTLRECLDCMAYL